MTPRDFPTRQREIVRALFIGQTEVAARPPPLGAVWGDPAPARALVCEQVSEFVEKCAPDFGVAKFPQFRIQPHE